MADKNFRVKTGLQVPGVTSANFLSTDSNGTVAAGTTLPIANGGTGQTSADNAINALLPLQTGNDNKYLQTNGVSTQWNAVTYIPPTANSTSSNITLASYNRYFVDTTSARTLTLPSIPSVGDEIQIFDASGTAFTNNITLSRNGNKINGVSDNAIIDIDGASATLTYTGSTYGWRFE